MENLTHEDKLRIGVKFETQKICREIGSSLNVDFDEKTIDLIAEIVWKKSHTMAGDLEQFARHAKRASINADDVKLLLRRNPSLQASVSKIAESYAAEHPKVKKPRLRKGQEPCSNVDPGAGCSNVVEGGNDVESHNDVESANDGHSDNFVESDNFDSGDNDGQSDNVGESENDGLGDNDFVDDDFFQDDYFRGDSGVQFGENVVESDKDSEIDVIEI